MRTLYHWPLDPRSRQARLALSEAKLRFKQEIIDPWQMDDEFLNLSAEAMPPLLIDANAGGRAIMSGPRSICEYAHDSATARYSLLPENIHQRAETRRLCAWFDDKFEDEVNSYILHEKLEKPLTRSGSPVPQVLREGRENLTYHLSYFEWLLEKREWLACHHFSLADIAAGANISVLDFLGEINWKDWPLLKSWYQKTKSRPSFKPLLKDHVPGIIPPRQYADLDF